MATKQTVWSWRQTILESELPPTTRHVLLTIACFMNDVGGGCYPTTKQLAAATGLSERAVITHIASVAVTDEKPSGWLKISKHGLRGQKWKNHQYEAAWPGVEGTERGSAPSDIKALNVVPKGTEPDDKKALNDVQSNSPVNPPVNSPIEKERARGRNKDFELTVRTWPSGFADSRDEAMKAWLELSDQDRVEATREIPRYVSTTKSIGRSLICSLASYLRERRWEALPERPRQRIPEAQEDGQKQAPPRPAKPTATQLANPHLYPDLFPEYAVTDSEAAA